MVSFGALYTKLNVL